MKKLLLSVAFVALGLGVSTAQEISYGAKGGLNLASIVGDETDDTESRVGFFIGGYAEFKLSDKFSFQPELLYSAQGAKEEFTEVGDGATFSEEFEVKLNYLNVPLLAKYYITDAFSVEAGPQIGFLLSADAEVTESVTSGGVSQSVTTEADIKDQINSLDFAAALGLGYKLENGLNFGVRYNLGLSNINDSEDAGNLSNQNSVFQFAVGYTF